MKKTKNKDKKQGYSRLRIITGLLCVCVGVLTVSASFSGAWWVSDKTFSISKRYPNKLKDDTAGIEELAEAPDDEDILETLSLGEEISEAKVELVAKIEEENEETAFLDIEEIGLHEDDSDGTEDNDNIRTYGAADVADDSGDTGVTDGIDGTVDTNIADDTGDEAGEDAADDAVFEVWSYDDVFSFGDVDDSE